MDEKLLAQLRSIRNILLLGVLCLIGLVGASIYHVVDDVRENREVRFGRTFVEQADTLYREEEWDQLLVLSRNRQRQRPRDGAAFYWAGVAYLHKQQFDDAEDTFKQAIQRRPEQKNVIQAWLDQVNARRKEQAKK
ncbi:MAG TPA: hypothetical protein VF600_14065 [Abditibacteriaceae bacterium]|jgi:cytochrome c-type biogenesis protein CcmH/NrfG